MQGNFASVQGMKAFDDVNSCAEVKCTIILLTLIQ